MSRRILLIVLALGTILAAIAFYPPARALAIVATGRSPHCPMANALASHGHWAMMEKTKDRILAQSRKLEVDEEGYTQWATPYGLFWIPRGSDYVLPFNLAEQELNIYGTGEHALRAGDVVLDCGANVGVYRRKALAAGARLIVAIDPAPENLVCLRRSFAAEIAAGNVIVYPKGVWDKDDVLRLRVSPENSAADTFVLHQPGAVEGVSVPLTTIDRLVSELKLPRVNLVKMDIEGAETNALLGAQATLKKDHPRLSLSAYHLPTDPERIPALVHQAWPGYRMTCGPCAESNGYIRPDILYFQ